MGFYETALAKNNENKDGSEFVLPCNRYMGYSDVYKNDYRDDPNTARYVVAMLRIFDTLGLRDDEKITFLKYFNEDVHSKTTPLGTLLVNKKSLPELIELIQKSNENNIFSGAASFSGTCKDFYKEFDGACACCQICNYDKSDNQNLCSDEEEVLVDFLTSSPEIYSRVKPFYERNLDSMFRTVFDLHSSYPNTKPLILPFYKAYCAVLLKYDDIHHLVDAREDSEADFLDKLIEYYDTDVLLGKSSVRGGDKILAGAYSKLFLERFIYKSHEHESEKAVNVSYKKITGKPVDIFHYGEKKENLTSDEEKQDSEKQRSADNTEVDEIPSISQKPVQDAVEDVLNNEETDIDVKVSVEPDELDTKETDAEEEPDPEDEPGADEVTDEVEEDNSSDENTDDYDEVSGFDPSAIEQAVEEADPMAAFEDLNNECPDVPGEFTDNESDDSENDTPAEEEQNTSVPTDDNVTTLQEQPEDSSSEPQETTELAVREETAVDRLKNTTEQTQQEPIVEDGIIDGTAVVINEEDKGKWEIPVNNLGEDNYIIDNHFEMLDIYGIQSIDGHNSWSMQRFESSVLTNTFMVIEAIVDKDGTDYLLFYDRIHKSYYSMIMDPKSEAFNIVKPYLTRKMYIKITFQPYHLYGICRKYDIEIKNIFSIQSCYSYFIKNRPLKDYESTINFFVDKPLEETAPKDMPMLMAGMQLYPTVCARCRNKLDNPKTLHEVDAMRYFDEALGRSYYVGDLYSVTGDIPPFKLVGPNKYEFPSIDRGTALQKGQFFTCSFLSEYRMSEDDCWTMIRRSVEYLAYKGRFRKLRIYITQMTSNLLTLFVPQYDVAYMETALLSIFSEMSRRYLNNKKYKVIITQEVAKVEDQKEQKNVTDGGKEVTENDKREAELNKVENTD